MKFQAPGQAKLLLKTCGNADLNKYGVSLEVLIKAIDNMDSAVLQRI